MPCPPFLAEARQGALQTLAKRRRGIPLAAGGGEQRLGVERAQPAQHLGRGRRLGRDGQRARRERAEDGPQGGEDRLEGFAVPFGQAAHPSLERGARAVVQLTSRTDTPSSPRSTTRSGSSPPPPTPPTPRARPGRTPGASRSSCASSCLLLRLLACSLHGHRQEEGRP